MRAILGLRQLRRDRDSIQRVIDASNAAIARATYSSPLNGVSQAGISVSGLPWGTLIGRPVTTVTRQKSDRSFFDGRGQIHSVVYGLRNWNIDSIGRLTGKIYQRAVWMPGENHAKCLASDLSTPWREVAGFGEPDHDMTGCLHGFYAYYDGSRDYHADGDVTGVIKGWGEGVVGEKGFRVAKAEIVAIMFSPNTAPQIRDRIRRLYKVPEFDTLDAMLAEFPLTADDLEYVPEADDEFWTKEA